MQGALKRLEVEGRRQVGRPRKTWIKCIQEALALMGLNENQAEDKSRREENHKVSNHSRTVKMDVRQNDGDNG